MTEAAPPAERLGAPLVLALGLLVSTAPLSVDFYLPSFPAVQTSLHTSATEVQLTLTGFLVGLGLGQLLWGPISDRFGRRGPLLVGIAVSSVAALGAALAPSIGVLIAARLVQAVAGSCAVVIGRAIVPDLLRGQDAARAMALLTTVNYLAPMIAPVVGGSLAGVLSWRGILGIVVAVTVAQLVCAALLVPESLPPARRTASVYFGHVGRLLGRPDFRSSAVVAWLVFGMMMSYISSSSFVYQRVLGTPTWLYGAGFAVNACGLLAGGVMSARLHRRGVPPVRILRRSLTLSAVAAVLVLAVVVSPLPAWLLVVPLWFTILGAGFSNPNSMSLALESARDVAGSASAVVGAGMFLLGAAVSPLGGLGGGDSAVPLGVLLTTCAVAALGLFAVARRHHG